MMKDQWKRIGRLISYATLILVLWSATTPAQQQKPQQEAAKREEVELGRGMSLIAPGLMEISARSKLFLGIAEKIGLRDDQRKVLEELYFEVQRYLAQREADLDVADAELKRLMTRERIDLVAVRAKMKEIEAIRTDADIRRIETLLKSINVLDHGQHLKAIIAMQAPSAPGEQRQGLGIY